MTVTGLEPVDLGGAQPQHPVDQAAAGGEDDALPHPLQHVTAQRADSGAHEHGGGQPQHGAAQGALLAESVDDRLGQERHRQSGQRADEAEHPAQQQDFLVGPYIGHQ
ncbi:hypothetical protein [Streptosporangium sp. CA-115845]|uniref:hypothetical protein n=1 Tax=Streptosporangium sp. CA-115845 TaxID=3240071 RepID=UPI003D92F910